MSFSDLLAAISSPGLAAVARHWDETRAGRPLPLWSDIDPVELRGLLPIVFFWREDAAAGTFVCQLAGEAIQDAVGMRMRGRSIHELFPAPAASAISDRFSRVIREHVAMLSAGPIYGNIGKLGTGERLALPIGAPATGAAGVFGATDYRWEERGGDPALRSPEAFRLPATFYSLTD